MRINTNVYEIGFLVFFLVGIALQVGLYYRAWADATFFENRLTDPGVSPERSRFLADARLVARGHRGNAAGVALLMVIGGVVAAIAAVTPDAGPDVAAHELLRLAAVYMLVSVAVLNWNAYRDYRRRLEFRAHHERTIWEGRAVQSEIDSFPQEHSTVSGGGECSDACGV